MLQTIAALPLGFAQAIGGALGLLAFIGSGHYRSLFKQHYLSAATQNHLPMRIWSAACASGMLLSDSLWIWRNPTQALSRT
jgi:KDO2-lipid IV(A) lauroyltransferase